MWTCSNCAVYSCYYQLLGWQISFHLVHITHLFVNIQGCWLTVGRSCCWSPPKISTTRQQPIFKPQTTKHGSVCFPWFSTNHRSVWHCHQSLVTALFLFIDVNAPKQMGSVPSPDFVHNSVCVFLWSSINWCPMVCWLMLRHGTRPLRFWLSHSWIFRGDIPH